MKLKFALFVFWDPFFEVFPGEGGWCVQTIERGCFVEAFLGHTPIGQFVLGIVHRDDEGNQGEEVSRDGAMTLVLMVAVAAVLFFTVVMIVEVSFMVVMMVMIMFVFVVTAAFLFLRIDQRVETQDDDANPSGEDERVEVLGKVILNALRVIEIDQRTAPAEGEQSKEPGVES